MSGPDGGRIRSTPTYLVGRELLRVAYLLLGGVRVLGREHVPREGGVVLAPNHASFLDIPLVALATRRHVCFVARDTLSRSRFLRWLIPAAGSLLVRRGEADVAALREVVLRLRAGDAVTMFPEGTRTRDGHLSEFRGGGVLAARRARVPVVPVGIRGSYGAWPRHRRLPRPARLEVRFGPPIDPREDGALELLRSRVEELIGGRSFQERPPIG